MATFSRSVTVDWTGPIMEGKGEAKAGSGAFTLPVSFPSRIGEPAGKTSPEELIAAAHASCYAMALNATVGRKGGSIATTHVTATVVADKGDAGITLTTSKLKVVAEGLQGFECLSGIPGSTGATPIQNVGAYGQDVSETVEWVRVYDRETDSVKVMSAAECGFAYRRSVFKYRDRWTVLAVGGFVQWTLAIPLIIGNMAGSYVGSHLAIRKGDRFIRALFLVVVLALVARVAWGLLQG